MDRISPYCGGNTIVKGPESTNKQQPKPITNKERIRKMEDRELAEFLTKFYDWKYEWKGLCNVECGERYCLECMMIWLNRNSTEYGCIDER